MKEVQARVVWNTHFCSATKDTYTEKLHSSEDPAYAQLQCENQTQTSTEQGSDCAPACMTTMGSGLKSLLEIFDKELPREQLWELLQ